MTVAAPCVLADETPSPDEYRALRLAAGLSPKSAEGAAAGLPNSLFAVTLRHEGALIGMGRVVGDNGLFYQITDIAVRPDWQGRGLGKDIVGRLTGWINANAPSGAHISLLADGDAKHLYRQFGFVETAPASVGMDYVID